MLLACGTAGLTFVGFWFLRVVPHSSYQSVAATEEEDGKLEVEDAPVPGSMFEPGRSYSPSQITEKQLPYTKSKRMKNPERGRKRLGLRSI